MNIFKTKLFLLSMIGVNMHVISTEHGHYVNLTQQGLNIEKAENLVVGDKITRLLSLASAATLLILMSIGYYLDTQSSHEEIVIIDDESQIIIVYVSTANILGFIINSIAALLMLLSSACLSHAGFKKNFVSIFNLICIIFLFIIGGLITLTECDAITSTTICGFTGNTQTTTQGLIDGIVMAGSSIVLLSRTIFSDCSQESYKSMFMKIEH